MLGKHPGTYWTSPIFLLNIFSSWQHHDGRTIYSRRQEVYCPLLMKMPASLSREEESNTDRAIVVRLSRAIVSHYV